MIEKYPKPREVFIMHGMPKYAGRLPSEKIEFFCRMHRVEINQLLDELNKAAVCRYGNSSEVRLVKFNLSLNRKHTGSDHAADISFFIHFPCSCAFDRLRFIGLVGLAFTMPYRYDNKLWTIAFGAISLFAIYVFVYNVARSIIPPKEEKKG